MVSTTFNTLLVAFAAAAAASPLQRRQDGVFQCVGTFGPNYGDCDILVNRLLITDIDQPLEPNTCLPFAEGNCLISHCNFDANTQNANYFTIGLGANFVKQNCEPLNSGGFRDLGSQRTEVKENPDFVPEPVAATEITNSSIVPVPRAVAKRQQPNDDGIEVTRTGRSVQRPGFNFAVSPRYPAGSTSTAEVSESQTVGFDAGTEISAGFEGVLSASVSFSVNFESTTTNTQSVTIPINCSPGQEGQIWWSPLYDLIEGNALPSGDFVQAWFPVNDGISAGNYAIRCFG
ncbi:unnamed protein product [Cercospora beticola]|nr:unnamed protein product [Cercospora beticola]